MKAFVLLFIAGAVYGDGVVELSARGKQRLVELHNEDRGLTGDSKVHNLVWDDNIANFAKTVAARQCSGMQHSSNGERSSAAACRQGSCGENIAMKGASWLSFPENEIELIEGAYEGWRTEQYQYDYGSNQCSCSFSKCQNNEKCAAQCRQGGGHGVCGHWTQVIWDNSNKVGCGAAMCRGALYIVCNYNPAGNIAGGKPYGRGDACITGETRTPQGSDTIVKTTTCEGGTWCKTVTKTLDSTGFEKSFSSRSKMGC